MSRAIFVTATNTDVGKTYASLMLLEEFAKRGLRVGVFKPIETGVKSHPVDGLKLLDGAKKLNSDFKDIKIDDVVAISYPMAAAPYAAKGDKKIDFSLIKRKFEKIKSVCDVVVVEGAGGLLVPVERDFFMYDFISFLDIDKTLLITHDRLGCINDTLLNMRFLNSNKIDFEWCVNKRESGGDFDIITLPYYRDTFGHVYVLQGNIETIGDKLLI